MEINKFRMTN